MTPRPLDLDMAAYIGLLKSKGQSTVALIVVERTTIVIPVDDLSAYDSIEQAATKRLQSLRTRRKSIDTELVSVEARCES